jgi:hypothetical protein
MKPIRSKFVLLAIVIAGRPLSKGNDLKMTKLKATANLTR